ncbi:MAG: tRNA (adenosine(37)-N6)-threonylcarbamoyltransferase complex ATPase subunit type 1 TsaE [Bradymonadales bacterium]|jgi:tRNA threonylcarbamoyladenosine biosynthesis protein TsaE
MIFLSRSARDSYDLGWRCGGVLRAGDVLALSGDLGAGKTQFVRGVAASYIGEGCHVCSPSFTLINRYEGGGRYINHLDLYRLSNLEELESAGYWDAVEDSEALVLIEWLEQVEKAEPLVFTQVWIDYVYESDELVEGLRHFRLLKGSDTKLYERLLPLFS